VTKELNAKMIRVSLDKNTRYSSSSSIGSTFFARPAAGGAPQTNYTPEPLNYRTGFHF
jgi:hypothetical protein